LDVKGTISATSASGFSSKFLKASSENEIHYFLGKTTTQWRAYDNSFNLMTADHATKRLGVGKAGGWGSKFHVESGDGDYRDGITLSSSAGSAKAMHIWCNGVDGFIATPHTIGTANPLMYFGGQFGSYPGMVGVGTIIPSAKLSIRGTTTTPASGIAIGSSAGNGNNWAIFCNGTDAYLRAPGTTNDVMTFGGAGGSYSGRLGINTLTPERLFHFVGTAGTGSPGDFLIESNQRYLATFRGTENNAAGTILEFYKTRTGQVGDYIADIVFAGKDSSDNKEVYNHIKSKILDPGGEKGQLEFYSRENAATNLMMFMSEQKVYIEQGNLCLKPRTAAAVDATYGQIYIDSSDGDLKIRFPNNTVATIATN